MRILQATKIADGVKWAVLQVAEHVRAGLGMHVALPRPEGREIENWKRTGATLHFVDLSLPTRRPCRMGSVPDEARRLVRDVAPDVVHTHFVTTTLALRLALGSSHPTSRLFQVPGPLHLENSLFARLDLATAGPRDHSLASSRHIRSLYAQRGAPEEVIGISYYGTHIDGFAKQRTYALRRKLGISDDTLVVGHLPAQALARQHGWREMPGRCHRCSRQGDQRTQRRHWRRGGRRLGPGSMVRALAQDACQPGGRAHPHAGIPAARARM